MEKLCYDYYKNNIEKSIPKDYSNEEKEMAFSIFKSISFSVWSDNELSDEIKVQYLEALSKKNIYNLLVDSIESIKKHNIKEPILMRDLSSLPHEWLFHNQKVYIPLENVEKIFKTTKIFSTGDIKIGFQEGVINEDGKVKVNLEEKAVFDEDKCYFMLSFLETRDLTNGNVKENIFFDYFLGNESIE